MRSSVSLLTTLIECFRLDVSPDSDFFASFVDGSSISVSSDKISGSISGTILGKISGIISDKILGVFKSVVFVFISVFLGAIGVFNTVEMNIFVGESTYLMLGVVIGVVTVVMIGEVVSKAKFVSFVCAEGEIC